MFAWGKSAGRWAVAQSGRAPVWLVVLLGVLAGISIGLASLVDGRLTAIFVAVALLLACTSAFLHFSVDRRASTLSDEVADLKNEIEKQRAHWIETTTK